MSDFHLYYHDDLDGTASGAVFLDFLRKRGDDLVSFTPLEYNSQLEANPGGWENHDFQHPFVLVDFQYHPKADWWIDHHASAFKKPEWQASFKEDDQHHWDASAPSACGLVARFLHEHYGYELSPAVADLVAVVDMDDSAAYPTLASALELDSPGKQIQLLLGDTESKKDHGQYLAFREFLIKNFIVLGMEKIVRLPEYQPRIKKLQDQRRVSDALIQKLVSLQGKVIYVEKNAATTHAARWAPYVVYPEAPYSVQISDKGGEFKIGIGSNKWSKEKSTVDL